MLCTWTACKGKEDAPKAKALTAADLDKRCEQLVKTCGETGAKGEKLLAECKQVAAVQAQKNCIASTIVAYDCFEKELCGPTDKRVWVMSDFSVLVERHTKCASERDTAQACASK